MANEELQQRGYFVEGRGLKGDIFGKFECFELGATNLMALKRVGLISDIPKYIDFPFSEYKPPRNTNTVKPDSVFIVRNDGDLNIVATRETKAGGDFTNEKRIRAAQEQGLFVAALLDLEISVVDDGSMFYYIDVKKSLEGKEIILFTEKRSLNPGVLEDLIFNKASKAVDPASLAGKVWQAIWHATKEEPKQCLLTFVEFFVLKFLSDNLTPGLLPKSLSFYELTDRDSTSFTKQYGKTQIEYYVENIRPKIKELFPSITVIKDSQTLNMFELGTHKSPSSVINGFAFLKSGATTVSTYNRAFLEILGYFKEFGPLTKIDPEFKLRLYEKFLKKSAKQSKLGQFFTPRNIVKSIVRMAQVEKLAENSIVFDPAAGVGGFILETLIDENNRGNIVKFDSGKSIQRLKLIGADVDIVTHTLAKANALIHLAEHLRDPKATIPQINQLISEMFLIFNSNETLGTLEYPTENTVDLIMTNPPYVTQGSKVYKEEISLISAKPNSKRLLKTYYNNVGLGLESLFARYVSGALKPGGRAFVIVPQGMLTRTEISTKKKILEECNLIASISLPRNAFFNTPQKTYLIVLEKRHTKEDSRPLVFCAIASSIGESLDAVRFETPNDDTLKNISEDFVSYTSGSSYNDLNSKERIKIKSPDEFKDSTRWDVYRLWADDELVEINEKNDSISKDSFVDEIEGQLNGLMSEISEVKLDMRDYSTIPVRVVDIKNNIYFKIRKDTRVTKEDARLNPGTIPVYSGRKSKEDALGYVSREWAIKNDIPIEKDEIITVNSNGSVGFTFVRNNECIIHDDVTIIEVLNADFDIHYVANQLQAVISDSGFGYEAKIYGRVRELSIDIPIEEERAYKTSDGEISICSFDIEAQKEISDAIIKINTLKAKLNELGNWSGSTRIK